MNKKQMKNKIVSRSLIVLLLSAFSVSGLRAQQLTFEQIKVANETKIFADGCKNSYLNLRFAYDTLSIAFEAEKEAVTLVESQVDILKRNLERKDVLIQSCQQDLNVVNNQLKRAKRGKKATSVILYIVSGVAAAFGIMYLTK